ncbi:protocatechuate 3,4-dioxygenase subunit alpha [Caulobacter sp. BP25]|uniref:protocatechuate 3,4-dioxygenase subunit alpha n=1 Tax=Caulobacter sp. BP25 TaxID=2048900 RepID=UPI000C12B4DA|nr:protocatechuate 3,4-dioxygenase subunit alpha [Caulobacter sp. BP25]PHY18085.1 protocatechuate 3,4-dioxygenase subunit alpha [Caulobacter sp. BP25]
MTPEQARPAPRQDSQDPAIFGQTPWQTVGPFFHYGLPWKGGADLVGTSDIGARPELMPPEHYLLASPSPKGEIAGETIVLEGVVVDAEGQIIPDAMIEIWQADAAGHYAEGNTGFVGFGRASTGEDGTYRFRTVLPGSIGEGHAPHIAVGVFGRGLLKRLVTRVYFEGDPANASDPILALVPPERRGTLMARKQDGAWRFDIVLQGERETVFFDV